MIGGFAFLGATSSGNVIYPAAADYTDSLDTSTLVIAGHTVARANALSSLRLSVAAGCSALTVFGIHNDAVGAADSLPLFVDGVYSKALTFVVANSVEAVVLTLDKQPHTVEIVNGSQGYGVNGAWVRAVSSVGGAVAVLPNPSVARRLAVYGDSIAVGALADLQVRHGWVGILRTTFSGRIAVEAWGGRALHDESAAVAAARLVGLCFDASQREIWDGMGYNDWGGSGWTAADYGAGVGTLYDLIHAADPQVHIYSQTPLITAAESATNALAETIVQFRAAKAAAACTARLYQVVYHYSV